MTTILLELFATLSHHSIKAAGPRAPTSILSKLPRASLAPARTTFASEQNTINSGCCPPKHPVLWTHVRISQANYIKNANTLSLPWQKPLLRNIRLKLRKRSRQSGKGG